MTLHQLREMTNDRKYIELAIRRIKGKIESARERAERIGARISSEGRGKGGVCDPVGSAVDEIDYYTRMLEDYEGRLAAKQNEIERTFEKIGDQRVKLALQYKFVDGLTWFRTAGMLEGELTADGVRMMCQRFLENNF